MAVTAASLIAKVSVDGADKAKSDLEDVGKTVNKVGSSVSKAGDSLGGIGGIVGKVGGFIGGALKDAAIDGGKALIGIGVQSTEMAGDFEAAMIKIKTSAGETGTLTSGNLKVVSDGILQLATTTGTSADDLAQSMYFVESAGMRGASGLKVLQAAAEGAKLENVDTTQVTRALLAVMEGYHMPAEQATNAMNALVSATSHGGASLNELTGAMAQVLPTASSLHIPFEQVAAAIGVMTNKQTSARQAAQNLTHVLLGLEAPNAKAADAMTNVGLSAQKVRDALVNQGLPQALQMIEDHVGQKFPKDSVEYTSALKDILGGIVGFKLAAQLTGPSLNDMKKSISEVSGAAKDSSGNIMGWADTQNTLNVKMAQAKEAIETLQIKIGMALLPAVSNLLGTITPLISKFTEWLFTSKDVQNALSDLTNGFTRAFTTISDVVSEYTLNAQKNSIEHTKAMAEGTIANLKKQRSEYETILANTTNQTEAHMAEMKIKSIDASLKMQQGVIDNANKMSSGVNDALAKIDPIVRLHMDQAKMAALNKTHEMVQGTINNLKQQAKDTEAQMLKTHDSVTRHMLQGKLDAINHSLAMQQGVLKNTDKMRSGVESDMKKTQKAVDTLNSNPVYILNKAWHDVTDAVTKFWGKLQPLINYIGGIFAPIIREITDEFNGPLKKAWKDFMDQLGPAIPSLKEIAKAFGLVLALGLVGFLQQLANSLEFGAWVLARLSEGVLWFGTQMLWLYNQVKPVISWIAGLFQWLYDLLLGHSIIPDLINGIVNWFSQLPGRVMGWVNNLMGQLGATLGDLGARAISWGSDMINGFASGVASAGGNLIAQAQGIASQVASILHFSKPDTGPLRDADQWMPDMMQLLADGMTQNLGKVKSAALNVSATIANPNSQSSFAGSSTGGLGGLSVVPSSVSQGATPINITVQSAPVYLDGKALSQGMLGPLVNQIRAGTGTFNF